MTESMRLEFKENGLGCPKGSMNCAVPLEFDPTQGHLVDPSRILRTLHVMGQLPTGPPIQGS